MSNEQQHEQIKEQLLGEGSDDLIRFMHLKSLHQGTAGVPEAAAEKALALGWTEGLGGPLTMPGRLASDSCREYTFWLERNKALPFEGAAPHLSSAYFSGRKVLEIGAGMGHNLLSLAKAGAEVCGIEPIPDYIMMGSIFAEREGLPPADVRPGAAEALPFGDDEVDCLLCITAHQYFDVHPALREIARVLRPGGEVIIVGGTLGRYSTTEFGTVLQGLGAAKAYAITVTNTVAYTATGQRLLKPRNAASSTSRPIYPPRHAMRRWLEGVGLQQKSPECPVENETCFHYVAK